MFEPTVALSSDQIAFFNTNGFLAIEALTTQEEVRVLQGVYDEIFARRAGRERGDQFDLAGTDEEGKEAALPQILNPGHYAPLLREGLLFANATAVARQLLGPECNFGGDHAIFKPAQKGAATPWHQDEAYWDPAMDYRSISIWVPLQEATLANGCMHFLPGSQNWEVMPHHSIGHDPRVHGLEIDQFPDPRLAVACPLPPGGATIHLSRTLHYTGANTTTIPRRAYIMGFSAPATTRTVTRDFYWNRLKQTAREERARESAPPAA
jgi:ectoine hydroxylase-related dioxygenase (phytanoyl-CoA dioxygenase family)